MFTKERQTNATAMKIALKEDREKRGKDKNSRVKNDNEVFYLTILTETNNVIFGLLCLSDPVL